MTSSLFNSLQHHPSFNYPPPAPQSHRNQLFNNSTMDMNGYNSSFPAKYNNRHTTNAAHRYTAHTTTSNNSFQHFPQQYHQQQRNVSAPVNSSTYGHHNYYNTQQSYLQPEADTQIFMLYMLCQMIQVLHGLVKVVFGYSQFPMH